MYAFVLGTPEYMDFQRAKFKAILEPANILSIMVDNGEVG